MIWASSDFHLNWFHRILLYLIKFGPIPKHIAFIMDGNRRFAKRANLNGYNGHVHGFSKLTETLQWCRNLGIEEVSVYAFSIENFGRNQEEVNFLFNLAEEKIMELLKRREELFKEDIAVRVIGNLRLLPTNIQRLCSELMLLTRHNNKSILNIFMAYTSRDEITTAVEKIHIGIKQNLLIPSDIDANLLSECLYTRNSRPVDLLVRTSGEVRLSDFLVWQAGWHGAVYRFVDSFWPNFTITDFLSALLHYQLSVTSLPVCFAKQYKEDPRLKKSSKWIQNGSMFKTPTFFPRAMEEVILGYRIPSLLFLKKLDKQSTQRVSDCECESPTTRHQDFRVTDHAQHCRVRSFLKHLDQEYWHELEKMRLYSILKPLSPPNVTGSESRVTQRFVGDTSFS